MVQLIRPEDRVCDEGSDAMARFAAISGSTTGAEKLWVGHVGLPAGAESAVHHHGVSESAIYIISGHARFFFGEDLSELVDARSGDFIWVPPNEVHAEVNLRFDEPVEMVVCRSTQEAIVVNLPPPPGWVVNRDI